MHDGEIVGRGDELRAISSFFSIESAGPRALLLEGEAGIGKTSLWQCGVQLAIEAGYQVVSCAPAQSEAQLSFAGLGDLLQPALPGIMDELPEPQRRALAIALLIEEPRGRLPSPYAIGLAVLGTVRRLAGDCPLLIAVDDLHWLDTPSALALEFTLRRLHDAPVSLLCGARTGEGGLPLELDRTLPEGGLHRHAVGPLGVDDVHILIKDRLELVLERRKLRRLHELSGGNPLFALELGRAYERGATRLEADEALPLSVSALVDDRLARLPRATWVALRAAAALPQPTVERVTSAIGTDARSAISVAADLHIVECLGDRILFSHPLFASAVLATADAAERRALHQRIAALVDDPEERARHFALASVGPDAEIAQAVEDGARRARSRGAVSVAADLAELGRRLTPEERDDDRHRRTIQAAMYAFWSGESSRTRELLETALAEAPPGPRHAEIVLRLGKLGIYEGDRRDVPGLLEAALAEVGDELRLRAQLETDLAEALFLLRSELPTALDHARSAVALAAETEDPGLEVAALSVHGLIDAMSGGDEWRSILSRGVALEETADLAGVFPLASYNLGVNLTWTGELDRARTIFRDLHGVAEGLAEESRLPWILSNLGLVEFGAGRWDEAGRLAREGYELALQTHQAPQRLFALGVGLLVHAARGETDTTRSEAAEVLAAAEENGAMIAVILASSAIGLLELALDQPQVVHDVLGPLGARLQDEGVREPGSMLFVADDVEALIAMGCLDAAERTLARFENHARNLDRSSALAAAGRCRALVAATRGDLDAALTLLHQALHHHTRAQMPFEVGRTLLALGVVRRRAKMKRGARDALEESLESFERLGARLWAQKARAELARIGGRRPSAALLTPTERRIAELASDGLTDKEIAAELFVTPKTVATQLSRIYRKVGVRSRTELAARLRDASDARKVS